MFIDFIYQNLYLFYVFTEKFKQTQKKHKDNQEKSYLKSVQKVIQNRVDLMKQCSAVQCRFL